MFVRHAIAAVGMAALWLPAIAYSREVQLAPSSKWLLNYDRDSCTLVRSFGEDDEKIIAQFVRYAPGPTFDLNLFGKRVRAAANRPTVGLRFGNTGNFVATPAMKGTGGEPGRLVNALFLAGRLDNFDQTKLNLGDPKKLSPADLAALSFVDPALEAATDTMTVRLAGQAIVLRLGSMGAAMREMRKCTTDLVKEWGLQPEEQERLASQPAPRSNPGTWLTSSDYPRDSLARGEQAIIRFRMMIDSTGVPTACAVQSAITKGDFAEITCNQLKRRARFEPARNAEGQPVASFFVGKVVWVM